jgi:lipid A 3-O-deacylase
MGAIMAAWLSRARVCVAGSVGCFVLAPTATAQGSGATINFAPSARLDLAAASGTTLALLPQDDTDGDAPVEVAAAPPRTFKRFGDADTWRINAIAWYADDFDTERAMSGAVGLSYFVIDNLSIDMELGLVSFDQKGPDAWGGQFALLFRWHFLARSSWSIYFDGGAGFLKTNDDVPANGSNYNFTPQAGFGASFDVGGDLRLMVGARWFHVSNANTADSNPGIDSLQVYAALSIPF